MRCVLGKGIQCSTFNPKEPEYLLSLWSLLYPFLKGRRKKNGWCTWKWHGYGLPRRDYRVYFRLFSDEVTVLSGISLQIPHPLPAALTPHTAHSSVAHLWTRSTASIPSFSECTAQPRCPSQRPAPPSSAPPGGGASARRSAMAAAAFCSPCSALRPGLAPLCRWRALPRLVSRRAGSVPRSAARYGTPPSSSWSSLLLLLALFEGRGGPALPCPAGDRVPGRAGPSPGWMGLYFGHSVGISEWTRAAAVLTCRELLLSSTDTSGCSHRVSVRDAFVGK